MRIAKVRAWHCRTCYFAPALSISGKGIGLSLESFSRRFSELCEQHLRDRRARAFAFIFYDFYDGDFRRVLEDQGVFTKLDRLSGDKLGIFYLHSGSKDTVERFNSRFAARVGLDGQLILPCMVFFKVKQTEITDLQAVNLESRGLIHGFDELRDAITHYISGTTSIASLEAKYWPRIKSGVRFIGIEVFRALLREVL